MLSARNPFDLPVKIPIFPLTGAILMPFGHLPLNIFEPRYINMIDDVLGSARLIGMVQPRNPLGDPVPDDAELYDIGTVGRVIQFNDPGNGRYLITLEGLMRFRITATHAPETERGYRMASVAFDDFEHDLNPVEHDDGPGRQDLLELMRQYFGENNIDADWGAVSDAPYEALVTSLTMSCPFQPQEKQALLECMSHEDRAQMLISLFHMSGAEPTEAVEPLKH